ncbi:MAG: pyruvate ferredoxin oxidoreductase [Chloroflexi bacterium]|nr:pyruvate ferredoxin oxidoreductase [Chloroflexota bacterium]
MATRVPVKRNAFTGNKAAAHALQLARIQVLCFFPIGPSDEVGEEASRLIQKGELNAKLIELENERSVMNAQITATQAGVRCSFATNSEGLLIAAQQLLFASYARIPMVVVVAHRALEPPAVVRSDDQDTIMYRDIHWLHYHCENAQDVLDTLIQAYRVSEHPSVLLPAFVTYDGWEVSHNSYPVQLPSQEAVDRFLPPFRLPPELDFVKNLDFAAYYSGPRMSGYGYIDVEREYMERRYQLDHALNVTAKEVIRKAHGEYRELMGRGYGGLIETYKMEDAQVAVVAMGSLSATSRFAVDLLREQGKAVGLVKVRTFRPFPSEDLVEALKSVKAAVVLDRNPVAAVYHDLRSALFGQPKPPMVLGRVVGLGGRDVTYYSVMYAVEEAMDAVRKGRPQQELAWHFEVIEDEEMLAKALRR